ncbi:MAG: hypothetical protein JO213_20795 [Alphaproteobacteria bacterium]|nr:hypothetical protein [Alphaproteobacteria bacterium]
MAWRRLLAGYLVDRFFAAYVASVLFLAPIAGFAFLANALGVLPTVGVTLLGLGLGTEIDLIAFVVSRYFGHRSFGQLYGYLLYGLRLRIHRRPISRRLRLRSAPKPFIRAVLHVIAVGGPAQKDNRDLAVAVEALRNVADTKTSTRITNHIPLAPEAGASVPAEQQMRDYRSTTGRPIRPPWVWPQR